MNQWEESIYSCVLTNQVIKGLKVGSPKSLSLFYHWRELQGKHDGFKSRADLDPQLVQVEKRVQHDRE